MRHRALTVLLLCLAILFISLMAGCGSPGPDEVVRSFYRHLDRGEISAALSLLSSSFRELLGDEKLRAGLEETSRKMKAAGGLEKVVIDEVDIQGETATVQVTASMKDGTSSTEEIQLVKRREGWRLQPSGGK